MLLVHTATAPNAVLHTLPVLPAGAVGAQPVRGVGGERGAHRDVCPRPPRDVDGPPDGDTQAELLDRAVDHGDEHVIKFTDTAVDVYDRTGDPRALAAAARISELL